MTKCLMWICWCMATLGLSSFSFTTAVPSYSVAHNSEMPQSENLKLQAMSIFKQLKTQNESETQQLSLQAFTYAYTGMQQIKQQYQSEEIKDILTICDFSLSANTKRLWVIDLAQKKVLFHSLVSHGRNTGEEYAVDFSNKVSSYKSSLGFYLTSTTYQGGNGYSLKLHGLDKGLNDKAEERAIVMHGAPYCNEQFIAANGRLGRSLGCPAVPQQLSAPIINTIKEKSVLYIHHQPSLALLSQSKWIAAPDDKPSLRYAQSIDTTKQMQAQNEL